MKKSLFLISACALAMTACSVSEIDEVIDDEIIDNQIIEDEGKLVTLTATVDEGNTTKVAIVDHKYNWQAGDVIAVFQDDGTENPIKFTASTSAASSAFTAKTDKTIGKYAFYPYEPAYASSFGWLEDEGHDIMSIKLPGSYTYSDNTHAGNNIRFIYFF